jgi:fatty-acyl-CoA synthase
MSTSQNTYVTSYRPAKTAETLVDMAIGDLLRLVAGEYPAKIYLVEGSSDPALRRRLTYAEVLERSLACGRFFAAHFSHGDRLAIWAVNSIEWAIVEFGAAFAGVTLVTLNPAYKKSEVEYVLRQSRASGLIMDRGYRGLDFLSVIEALNAGLPDLHKVFLIDQLERIVAEGPAAELPLVRPTDYAMIQYTSGTTGLPKGAVLTHFGLVNNARLTALRLAMPRFGVWLLSLPMFHTGGSVYSLLGSLSARCSVVVMAQFEPELLLFLIEQERVVYFQAVPTMHLRILDHQKHHHVDLSSLRGIGSGGTTVPEALVRRIENEYGCEYFMIFGQTEVSSVACHTIPGDTTYHKAQTIGFPLDHIEMKIIHAESGEILPVGETGEICIRGFGVLAEYFDMPAATKAVIGPDGWMRTGDLGVMLEDGYFKLVGRLKDMVIRGGENISPREIEDLLVTHPTVKDAAVFGIPDPHWGEELAVALRIEGGEKMNWEELDTFLRSHLSRHKVPKFWYEVDEFPLTPSGKVQKFILREKFKPVV